MILAFALLITKSKKAGNGKHSNELGVADVT
jgi:hypothetical protein